MKSYSVRPIYRHTYDDIARNHTLHMAAALFYYFVLVGAELNAELAKEIGNDKSQTEQEPAAGTKLDSAA